MNSSTGRAADEVFIDDPFQDCGRRRAIPDTFRVDHCDRTLLADPETVCLRTVNTSFRVSQPQFSEPLLQIIPGQVRRISGSTLRLRLVGTEKDMPLDAANVQFSNNVG